MAYDADKKPSELSVITSPANDDTFIVGDTSDTTEVVKTISWTNLKTAIQTAVEAYASYFNVSSNTLDDITTGSTNVHFTASDNTKLDAIEASADVTDATNVASAGAVMADGSGNDITGDIVFTEKADHSSTPGAGKGYLWTKNTAPSTLIFTDDTGADTTLGSGGGGLSNVVEDTTPQLGGNLDGQGNDLTGLGTVSMTEQAAANADVAGDGQLWVKTATPNQLWFTDDAGTDFQLASLAGTETLTNKTINAANNTLSLTTDSVDAITEIASALKSGADTTLVTGTAGTSGDLSIWNADGDLVDGPTPPSGTIVGTTDTQTLTNKTISGASNTISNINLASQVTGNLPVGNLNSGTGASGSTFWRGDGTWATPSGSGDVSKVGTPVDNQIGVWTGDGTIEGDAALTFDTTTDTLAIGASGKLNFGAVNILSDSAGTTTLANIDALDATTESTIESAIDTLPNLTSASSLSITESQISDLGSYITGSSPTITTPTLTLKQGTAPTPTAEGDIQWDTDDNKLVVGDGAAQKVFVPTASVSGDATMSTAGAVTLAATNTNLTSVANVTTVGTLTSGNADAIVSAASTTTAGKIEVATSAETNTGTDAARAVSPDGLAGSNFGIRYVSVTLNGTTALTTSDAAYYRIPAAYNGMNLVSVAATVGTGAAGASSSGTPTFTVKNVTDANQMLSTNLTVDATEYTSATAATAAVINTSTDDVVTDDLIEVACTTAGTGVTYATITMGYQLP